MWKFATKFALHLAQKSFLLKISLNIDRPCEMNGQHYIQLQFRFNNWHIELSKYRLQSPHSFHTQNSTHSQQHIRIQVLSTWHQKCLSAANVFSNWTFKNFAAFMLSNGSPRFLQCTRSCTANRPKSDPVMEKMNLNIHRFCYIDFVLFKIVSSVCISYIINSFFGFGLSSFVAKLT